jgi:hypothetical protein
LAAATTVTAALTASVPVAHAASNTTTPGWRFAAVFPALTGFNNVSAASVTYQWGVTSDGLTVGAVHLTSTGWKLTPPPLSQPPTSVLNLNNPQVVATSGQKAWAFAELDGANSGQVLATEWTGSAWSKPHDFGAVEDFLGTAFGSGPADVWQIGAGGSANQIPEAYHYTGTTWSKVTFPVVSYLASGSAAAGDWVLGQVPSKGDTLAGIKVLHWVNGAWKQIALPTGIVPSGKPVLPVGIAAASPDSVWAAIEYGAVAGPNPGTEILLHWNGSKWSRVSLPKGVAVVRPASPDGHGGLFGTVPIATGSYTEHWSGGYWTRNSLPAKSGYLTQLGNMSLIPGTHSVIAAGLLYNNTTSATEGAIIKYVP